MSINEELLQKNCNTECPRYAAGNCLFLPSEKVNCPRIREYLRAIYDITIPAGMTAKEFLEDERLAGITWKHIVRYRFDEISYEAFENAIKIIGNVEDV